MTFLIVRVRSDRGVERSIRDTMAMMNLTRVNHATLSLIHISEPTRPY